MGLKKLFVITVLAGAMSVLGCGDDGGGNGNGGSGAVGNGGTGGGGTGGNGGGATDFCTGGLCDSDTQVKTNCQDLIGACNDFEGGAGGTGGSVPPTSDQCNEIGTAYCISTGAGGSGGSGGTGGTPELGCDEGKCTNPENAQICEDFVLECIVICDETVNPCGADECIGIGLLWCNIE